MTRGPVTLAEARAHLREAVYDGGAKCPCCTQFAKVYRRKLTASTGASLVQVWRSHRQTFVHFPTVLRSVGHEEAKARYWGLIEPRGEYRDDGAKWSGFWRLTDLGVGFVQRRYRVPKYALIYDGRCLGLEGDEIGIDDVLGTRFDYSELMRGE